METAIAFGLALLLMAAGALVLRLIWLAAAKFVTDVLKRSRVALKWVYIAPASVFAVMWFLGTRQLTSVPYDSWQGDIPINFIVGTVGVASCVLLAYWEQQYELKRLLRSENSNPS